MILVVGGIKGGSGKTTIATNLTVMRSLKRNVLLVDADEQKSTSIFSNQRDCLQVPTKFSTIQLFGKTINSQVKRLLTNYDDIIIDVGGRDTTSLRSSLTIADIFLIPFKPRAYDIWTLADLKTLIREMMIVNPTLKSYAFINMADPKGSDNEDAINILKECEDIKCMNLTIGNRKTFGSSSSDGLSVIEVKNTDSKALKEMRALYDYIYPY